MAKNWFSTWNIANVIKTLKFKKIETNLDTKKKWSLFTHGPNSLE